MNPPTRIATLFACLILCRGDRGVEAAPQPEDPKPLYERAERLLRPGGADFDPGRGCADMLEVARRAPASSLAPIALDEGARCRAALGDHRAPLLIDTHLLVEHDETLQAARARIRLARQAASQGEPMLARMLLAPVIAEGSRREPQIARDTPEEAASDAPSSPPPEAPERDRLRLQAKNLDALITRAARDARASEAPRRGESLPMQGAEGSEVLALRTVPSSGEVLVLDEAGSVRKESGEIIAATPESHPQPRGFALDPNGGIWFWDERGITPPGGERFEPSGPPNERGESEPLRRIRGIAPGALGELDLIDGAEPRVLRYGPDRAFKGVLARLDSRPHEIQRSLDGTLYVLLPSLKEVFVLNVQGPPTASVTTGSVRWRRISLKGAGSEPVEAAGIAVDDLGRLHVLDANQRAVLILGADDRRIARVVPQGLGRPLRSPVTLAVDGAGRIHVGDRARIVRID